MVHAAYSKGNLTVSDLSLRFKVSERTIYRRLSGGYKEALPNASGRDAVVLMDATYWGRSFGVVIMKDAISGLVLWFKFIYKKETLADYREGVDWLVHHGYKIRGVVADGLKGLREMFSEYPFQLCQFHQVMAIKTKLTQHPKLVASQELLALARTLCHSDKESFIGAFERWEDRWADFLKERRTDENGRSHYIHKELRSAYLGLKRNMKFLWTWYDRPELEIPNTNNAIEALNSDLKAKLSIHRGMSIERRKAFIQDFIKAHSPKR